MLVDFLLFFVFGHKNSCSCFSLTSFKLEGEGRYNKSPPSRPLDISHCKFKVINSVLFLDKNSEGVSAASQNRHGVFTDDKTWKR